MLHGKKCRMIAPKFGALSFVFFVRCQPISTCLLKISLEKTREVKILGLKVGRFHLTAANLRVDGVKVVFEDFGRLLRFYYT